MLVQQIITMEQLNFVEIKNLLQMEIVLFLFVMDKDLLDILFTKKKILWVQPH